MDDLILQSANKTFPLLATTKTTCLATFYPFVQQYDVTSAPTAYCKFPQLIDRASYNLRLARLLEQSSSALSL